jgi:GNAT superfamily N-acetyltransferase
MTITYRLGTIEDSQAVFQIFVKSLMGFGKRTNVMAITGGNDPQILESLWQRRSPMFEFLAQTASQFWVAEAEEKIIGYARSIQFDGLQELTEFFVSPDQQSAGVGSELLSRAFPNSDAHYRTIVATLDERALYRYLKAGVYARFPIKYFYRQAEKVNVASDLQFEPMQQGIHLEAINRIDKQNLGHVRESVYRWVVTTRPGFVYKRNGEVVGYCYLGDPGTGPFALLDENDYPAVLAHAESLMAERGEEFGVETPLINRKAIQYFTERRYRIDAFTVLFMSNEFFGRFENYLCFSPIFFM